MDPLSQIGHPGDTPSPSSPPRGRRGGHLHRQHDAGEHEAPPAGIREVRRGAPQSDEGVGVPEGRYIEGVDTLGLRWRVWAMVYGVWAVHPLHANRHVDAPIEVKDGQQMLIAPMPPVHRADVNGAGGRRWGHPTDAVYDAARGVRVVPDESGRHAELFLERRWAVIHTPTGARVAIADDGPAAVRLADRLHQVAPAWGIGCDAVTPETIENWHERHPSLVGEFMRPAGPHAVIEGWPTARFARVA